MWSDKSWKSPEFDSFWKTESPPTFEGILQGDGDSVVTLERQLVDLKAADTYYQFLIANKPADCFDSGYNHYLEIGQNLSVPLALTLEFSSKKTEAIIDEINFILDAAKKFVPRLSAIEFATEDGMQICSNPARVKKTGVIEKHLEGIKVKERKGSISQIRIEYALGQRAEVFKQFCELKSAIQGRFKNKLLSTDISLSSMPKFLAMNDISLFGEGEFILHGHLDQNMDSLAFKTSSENPIVPIGQLSFESGAVTDVNLQLVHCSDVKYFD